MATKFDMGAPVAAAGLTFGIRRGSVYRELWDQVSALQPGQALPIDPEVGDGQTIQDVRRRVAAGLKRFTTDVTDRHYQVRIVSNGDGEKGIAVICYDGPPSTRS